MVSGLKMGSIKSNNRKRYIIFLNIFLAIIVASQVRVWQAGPFSGYFFMQTFMGLVLLCLGAYGIFRWNKYGIIKRALIITLVAIGVAIFFEYEPVVGYLLR